MTALSYLSDSIAFVYEINGNNINNEEINSLVEEVDNLINSITESNLPEDVKTLLFKNLTKIRNSLFYYKISGIEGVRTSLEQTIGSLLIENQTISPVVENENVKGLFSFIDKLNNLFSTLNSAKDFIAPIAKLFLTKES